MVDLNIAVCVLFYEKPKQTIECIQSFLPSGMSIYVLNNNSSVSARDKLGLFCINHPQVKIIDLSSNLGVGVGRNHLIVNTTEDWLLFVDNDIFMYTDDWLETITRHIETNKDAEVFIPRLYNKHEESFTHQLYLTLLGDRIVFEPLANSVTNFFPGGASFVNRRLFDRLGLYDDQIFVGAEDYEFAIRGIRVEAPIQARRIEDIILVHDHRQVLERPDIDAVLTRYDVNIIRHSYERIKEKHNVILEDGWEPWVRKQASEMVVDAVSKKVAPQTCTLFMTDRCNFSCHGCYRKMIGINKFNDMKLSTVEKLLSTYPSVNSFCVAGLGEPTLCSDFANIVNYLIEAGKYVGIITNGTNLGEFQKLKHQPAYISISLYGYSNESYKSYCRVPAFEKVIYNYFRLKAVFNRVGFSYIVNKENYKDIGMMLTICDELNPDFLHLVNYLAYDISNPSEIKKIITKQDKEIISAVDTLCEGRSYVELRPIYIDLDNPGHGCKSYNSLINLDGEGNIGGCQRQIPPSTAFGNIFYDGDPFNSLKMQEMRSAITQNRYPHNECQFCFGNWA